MLKYAKFWKEYYGIFESGLSKMIYLLHPTFEQLRPDGLGKLMFKGGGGATGSPSHHISINDRPAPSSIVITILFQCLN